MINLNTEASISWKHSDLPAQPKQINFLLGNCSCTPTCVSRCSLYFYSETKIKLNIYQGVHSHKYYNMKLKWNTCFLPTELCVPIAMSLPENTTLPERTLCEIIVDGVVAYLHKSLHGNKKLAKSFILISAITNL